MYFLAVCGFIKTTFASIIKGNSSYGSGAITDCRNRLLVNITSFENTTSSFPEGTQVELRGKMRYGDNNSEALILQVRDLTYIKIVDGVVKTAEEMKKGYVPIIEEYERISEDQTMNQTCKKSGEYEEEEIPTKVKFYY